MHTASHAIVNLTLLDSWCVPEQRPWVVVGAVLPDMPIYAFYFYHRFIRGFSEEEIWKDVYYRDHWYNFFALFHSIPIALAVLLVGVLAASTPVALLGGSILLHNIVDLPLHAEDAHRHFYPFSNFRFKSPISYWNPKYWGRLVAAAEIVVVAGMTAWMYPQIVSVYNRMAMVGVNILFVIAYSVFYLRPDGQFNFDFAPDE